MNNLPERRRPLSEEQMEEIAERAAEKAVAKITSSVYQQVGKGVINKLMWLVGAVTVGIYFWLTGNGAIK